MPPNRAPAAMVETLIQPVLTTIGSGCKSSGGALAAPTETDHAPGAGVCGAGPPELLHSLSSGSPLRCAGPRASGLAL